MKTVGVSEGSEPLGGAGGHGAGIDIGEPPEAGVFTLAGQKLEAQAANAGISRNDDSTPAYMPAFHGIGPAPYTRNARRTPRFVRRRRKIVLAFRIFHYFLKALAGAMRWSSMMRARTDASISTKIRS